jgi:hypothetical protein
VPPGCQWNSATVAAIAPQWKRSVNVRLLSVPPGGRLMEKGLFQPLTSNVVLIRDYHPLFSPTSSRTRLGGQGSVVDVFGFVVFGFGATGALGCSRSHFW